MVNNITLLDLNMLERSRNNIEYRYVDVMLDVLLI